MAPIYDSDVAKDRWAKESWKHYELWEKVEHREKIKKRLWILATFIVFLCLSTIPVLVDRSPKWKTYQAVRELSTYVNKIKNMAAIDHGAYRLKFEDKQNLIFSIEQVSNCFQNNGLKIMQGKLLSDSNPYLVGLINLKYAKSLGVHVLTDEFCYDPLGVTNNAQTIGFGMIPVKDLANKRLDRVSTLVINERSAKISLD